MTAFKPAFKSMVAYTPAFIGAPYQLALRFSGRAKVGPDVMRHCHTGRKLTLNNRAHAALSQKAASLDTVEGVRWDTEGRLEAEEAWSTAQRLLQKRRGNEMQPRQLDAAEAFELVGGDRQRRLQRQTLFRFGVVMLLAACAATGDPVLTGGTAATFSAAIAAHNLIEVNGMFQDGRGESGPPASSFKIHKSPGAGFGLFATQAIREGDFLMHYDGERIDECECVRRYSHEPASLSASYIMRVTDDEYIDASDPDSCKFGRADQPGHLARYMNHANQHDHECNVAKFVARRPGGFVAFFAARDIAAGEELRYTYSAEYWDVLSRGDITPGHGHEDEGRVDALLHHESLRH